MDRFIVRTPRQIAPQAIVSQPSENVDEKKNEKENVTINPIKPQLSLQSPKAPKTETKKKEKTTKTEPKKEKKPKTNKKTPTQSITQAFVKQEEKKPAIKTIEETDKSTPVTDEKVEQPIVKEDNKQTLLTKFFVSSNPTENQFHYLFERELARRKKEEEERLQKIREEAAILEAQRQEELQRKKEERKRKKEEQVLLFQEDQERRRKEEEQKYFGKLIVPNLYLGNRLVAKNYDWLVEVPITGIVNATRELSNYFDSSDSLSQNEEKKSKSRRRSRVTRKKATDLTSSTDSASSVDTNDDQTLSQDKPQSQESVESVSTEGSELSQVSTESDDGETQDQKEENKETEKESIKEEPIDNSQSEMEIVENLENENIQNTEVKTEELSIESIEKIEAESESQTSVDRASISNITYFRINVEDSIDEEIHLYFPESSDFIEKMINSDQKVLVHCKEGMSRSPSIIISYLMIKLKWDLKKAYEHVLQCNFGKLRINDGFKRRLMSLDKSLFGTLSLDFFESRNFNTRSSNRSANSPTTSPRVPRSPATGKKRTRREMIETCANPVDDVETPVEKQMTLDDSVDFPETNQEYAEDTIDLTNQTEPENVGDNISLDNEISTKQPELNHTNLKSDVSLMEVTV